MNYLITYYGFMTPAEFILKVKEIVLKMSQNAVFEDFFEQVEKIRGMNVILENLIIIAISGTAQDRTNRNTQMGAVVAEVANLGTKVKAFCNGVLELMQSSGFTVTTKKPINHLDDPRNYVVKNTTKEGVVAISCDKVDGAKNYMLELIYLTIVTDPQKIKLNFNSTRCRFEISGLIEGAEASFQLFATGSKFKISATQPIVKLIKRND